MVNGIDTSPSALLDRLREQAPLVQCITNDVAMNPAANTLLAAGASPAMVHDIAEAGEFAANANALTINIGTLSILGLEGMKAAAHSANHHGKPWVLDPVAHFATAFRRRAIAELLALQPTIIRGNASEIMALSGVETTSRGMDSSDTVDQAEAAARHLATTQNAVVAVTGAVDYVTDGQRGVYLEGGSPLMAQITAMGCSLTCLIGAFAATAPEAPLAASVGALAAFAAAGGLAAQTASGPGSFAVHFLDQLAALDTNTFTDRLRIDIQESNTGV